MIESRHFIESASSGTEKELIKGLKPSKKVANGKGKGKLSVEKTKAF